MAKILVTGGAGFIGSHIVDALVEQGHQVVIVDDMSTGQIANLNQWAFLYEMPIESPKLDEVFRHEKPDYVFHLAAQVSLGLSFENVTFDGNSNIIGSINVLENCVKHGVKKIIFSSTAAVYGEQEDVPIPEDRELEVKSPYGISKATVESYLKLFKQKHGLEYAILRYANVYGPRQTLEGETGVIAIFVDQFLKGIQPKISGDGSQTRDFIYVKDVVAANIAALRDHVHGVYNISTNTETNVKELFYLIKELTGSHHGPIYTDSFDPGVSRSCLSNKKACAELGFEPQYSVRDGLQETIDHYRNLRLQDGIWIIMAAYNEEKRLGKVLKSLKAVTNNIVVIDDCSADDTCGIAKQYGVHVVRHPINYGQGAALQAGMEHAISHGAKVLVHFDGDGQMQIKDIDPMARPILEGEVDVTFGSRFLSDRDNVPWTKKYFIHKPAILVNALMTGMFMTDAHCGFRALSAEAAKKCIITQNRMAHATEILELVHRARLKYKEVPVDILYHEYGQKFSKGFVILKDLFLGKLFR